MKYLFKNKGKSILLPAIGIFLLVLTLPLYSQQLSMKLSMGMVCGGKISDTWQADQTFYQFMTSPGERSSLGPEIAFAFTYKLNKNIGFSLGSGYIIKSVYGTRLNFTPLEEGDFQLDSLSTPEIHSSFIPIDITVIFTVPVNYLFTLNFSGGMDYYLGKIRTSIGDEKHRDSINPAIIAGRLVWKYESDTQTLGYHLSAELEWNLADSTSLTFEALYRSAVFKNFDTKLRELSETVGAYTAKARGLSGENLGNEATFLYLQRYLDINAQTDIDYGLSFFDLSGFAFRLGLKYTF